MRPVVFSSTMALLRPRSFAACRQALPASAGARSHLASALLPFRALTSSAPVTQSSSGGAQSSSEGGAKAKGRKGGIIFFGLLVGATFGLGTWQSARYFWKKDVIDKRMKALEDEPLDISAVSIAEIPAPSREELRLVRLRGKLDWSRATTVSPRPPPKGLPDNFKPAAGNNGGLVIVPLRRQDGSEVLVIRGWYPLDALPFSSSSSSSTTAAGAAGAREEAVELFGTLRASEEPGSWAAAHREAKNAFSWLDLPSIASHVQLKAERSVCVEAVEPLPPRANVFPLTRIKATLAETFVMPHTHLIYAGTWYTLSLLGVFMTYWRFRKVRRGYRPPTPPPTMARPSPAK